MTAMLAADIARLPKPPPEPSEDEMWAFLDRLPEA
jgi:hypothetical protein